MAENKGYVVSGYHIAELAKHAPGKIRVSLDLGLTVSEVTKDDDMLHLPDGQRIAVELLKKVDRKRDNENCYLIEDDSLLYIYMFEGKHTYRLYEPHMDWPPTLWISGSMMHTVSVSRPTDEADLKVKSLGRVFGRVLDTCFGLGYSAIGLARSGAGKVDTYEISDSVIEIAKSNPWSKRVFKDSRIALKNEDVYEAVQSMKDESYDFILHDPPNVKIDGRLYSLAFYREMYRIMKRGGKVYHFVGGGRIPREYAVDYMTGVSKRLSEAGFANVKKAYRGFTAVK